MVRKNEHNEKTLTISIYLFYVLFHKLMCGFWFCRATGRRSNESIEMQPLHLHKGPKGVLRRMPRVRSDEIHETPADPPIHHEKDKTPSPIGAGLPLLQRLRLLKEKQVSWFYISANLICYI